MSMGGLKKMVVGKLYMKIYPDGSHNRVQKNIDGEILEIPWEFHELRIEDQISGRYYNTMAYKALTRK